MQTFRLRQLSTDLDCLLRATKPRSLGWGAEKHRKVGNEGGGFPNCGFRNGGRWGGGAEIPAANNGTPKGGVVKIPLPSVTNRHRLVVRLDETALVGAGGRKAKKVGNEGGEFPELRISKRRPAGWGAEIPPANKGSQKEEFSEIPLPSVIN